MLIQHPSFSSNKRSAAQAIDDEITYAHNTGISMADCFVETDWPIELIMYIYKREDTLEQVCAKLGFYN